MSKNRQLEFSDERADIQKRIAEVQQKRHPIALLLDRIHDSKNIGGIFRLADAARVEHIYLYQCTFDLKNRQLIRTARSTVKYVPYSEVTDFQEIKKLEEQFEIVSLEVTEGSIPYTDYKSNKRTLLVIGNEIKGVSEELLQISQSIHLPMHGINTSMNVVTATAIAVYSLLEKNV